MGSAGKSLLWKITECETDGTTCLPATQFGYQSLTSSFASVKNWGSGQDQDLRNVSGGYTDKDMIDMNGDALPDDVYRSYRDYSVRLNTGSSFASAVSWGSGQKKLSSGYP